MAEENIQDLLTQDKLSAVESVVSEIKKEPNFVDFDFDLKKTISVQTDLDKKIGSLSNNILPSSSSFISFDEYQKRKVITAPKSKNGIETKPPSPTVGGDLPKSNNPTIQQNSMGWVDLDSLIGKANLNLQHSCDFTVDLKFKACGVTFDIITANIKAMIMLKLEELLTAKIPFIGHIIAFIKMLKEWFDYIMYYVKMIANFIKCMAELIAAIVSFAKQLMALPSTILNQISGCLSSLRSLLLNSVKGVIENNAISSMISDVESMKNDVASVGQSIQSSVGNIKNTVKDAQSSLTMDNFTNSINNSVSTLSNTAMKWTEPPKMDISLINRMHNVTNTTSMQNAFKMP